MAAEVNARIVYTSTVVSTQLKAQMQEPISGGYFKATLYNLNSSGPWRIESSRTGSFINSEESRIDPRV
jgi:hypothetical protein